MYLSATGAMPHGLPLNWGNIPHPIALMFQ
jgi:hypothetical protein